MNRTPLYEYHKQNSKLVEFAGYEMPIWYTSITEEHLAVRERAGIFDVSHMGRVFVSGPDATQYLDNLVPTATSTQPAGKAFYSLLLSEQGGIVDDMIVLKMGDHKHLLIINAANTEKDMAHMRTFAEGFDVEIREITRDSTMIAIQGPEAQASLQPLTEINLADLGRFRHAESRIMGCNAIVTRTGYTGEDGFEIIIVDSGLENKEAALALWDRLARQAKPCGLGARDSLRIEAGLPLYGQDIDETTDPIEADLYWVVSRTKHYFVGSKRLDELSRVPPARIRRGLLLNDKIPRSGFRVLNEGDELGQVTSGTFSPILRRGIALAYVKSAYAQIGGLVDVEVRDSMVPARLVKLPFYDEAKYGWKRISG